MKGQAVEARRVQPERDRHGPGDRRVADRTRRVVVGLTGVRHAEVKPRRGQRLDQVVVLETVRPFDGIKPKVGASFTALIVMMNVCGALVSTPPFAVPPLSCATIVIVAVPFASAAGV